MKNKEQLYCIAEETRFCDGYKIFGTIRKGKLDGHFWLKIKYRFGCAIVRYPKKWAKRFGAFTFIIPFSREFNKVYLDDKHEYSKKSWNAGTVKEIEVLSKNLTEAKLSEIKELEKKSDKMLKIKHLTYGI